MNFALSKLIKYCEQHSTPQSKALYELERETHLKTLAPQMMSGHLQGKLLTLLSALMQPKAILEIGTFTGYAAICLASGLQSGGKLYTIEAQEELRYIVEKYVEKLDLQEKVVLYTGDAKQIIPTLDEVFDLVFIDAGKNDYAQYYDLVFDKVRPGGLIIADNVLWSGKVTQQVKDRDTQTIHNFNVKIQEDKRVDNLILPLRDGLVIVQKK